MTSHSFEFYVGRDIHVILFGKQNLSGCRPKAVRLVSGVGSEEVEFEPAVALEGKVEIYMQVFHR